MGEVRNEQGRAGNARIGSIVEVLHNGHPRPAIVTHVFSPEVVNVVAFSDGSYDPDSPAAQKRTSLRWRPELPDTVSWRWPGEGA